MFVEGVSGIVMVVVAVEGDEHERVGDVEPVGDADGRLEEVASERRS